MPKTIEKAIFHYPPEFTSLPDYTQRRGKTVEIIRELGRDEYDFEGELMYMIRDTDCGSWVGHAFESELERIDDNA